MKDGEQSSNNGQCWDWEIVIERVTTEMSFCLFPKWFCRVPVLISQRGSINWLSSICLSSIWLWIHRCWNMECKTPGRTWNPHSVIFRGKWHTQMICGVSGQNSSHLTSNVTLWTSTPDPVIWTAFVINREKLLWAQLIYFKCTYVTFSFNLLLWHQLCSSCLYLRHSVKMRDCTSLMRGFN